MENWLVIKLTFNMHVTKELDGSSEVPCVSRHKVTCVLRRTGLSARVAPSNGAAQRTNSDNRFISIQQSNKLGLSTSQQRVHILGGIGSLLVHNPLCRFFGFCSSHILDGTESLLSRNIEEFVHFLAAAAAAFSDFGGRSSAVATWRWHDAEVTDSFPNCSGHGLMVKIFGLRIAEVGAHLKN
jgi:hypothetical protein